MTPILSVLRRVLPLLGYLVFALVLAVFLVGLGYLVGQRNAERECLEGRMRDAVATLETLQALTAGVDEIERSLLRQADAQKRRQLQLQREFSDYAHRTADAECLDADGLRLWQDAIGGAAAQPADRSDGSLPRADPADQRHAPGTDAQPPGQHGDAPYLPPTPGRPAGIRVHAAAGPTPVQVAALTRARRFAHG